VTSTDPTDIRAFQRLSPRITTSGSLQGGDPARLAAIGVRRVINLAMPDHPEALPDAAAAMAAAGIAYLPIPVPFDAPDDSHYALFAAALAQDDAPVHVHCVMNWRVSAFFYRWHRQACGMDRDRARSLMNQQWSPDTSDHPAARQWAAFIADGDH
jgi:uncharacterized protein (TIGR01244 family)